MFTVCCLLLDGCCLVCCAMGDACHVVVGVCWLRCVALLRVVCCLQFVVCVCWLLFCVVDRRACSLFVVGCVLRVVCRLLFGSLFVVRCVFVVCVWLFLVCGVCCVVRRGLLCVLCVMVAVCYV